jgi:hypothetical protein
VGLHLAEIKMRRRLTIKASAKRPDGYGSDSEIEVTIDSCDTIHDYIYAFRSALITMGFSPEYVAEAFSDIDEV